MRNAAFNEKPKTFEINLQFCYRNWKNPNEELEFLEKY